MNEPAPKAPTLKKNMNTGEYSSFTPRAQQTLALARKEAERLNHNFLGTEHVLLGLIKLGQGTAVKVMTKKGINLETLGLELERLVGTGPDQKMIGNIPYTPRVKKVLALAQKEAKQLGHTCVGTEHLLLGLLREGDGVAAKVLRSLDVDVEHTRQDILHELGENIRPEQKTAHNLTPRAQQTLVLAREEADRLNHNLLGTEHMLLGLIKLGQGTAVNVLAKLGMDLETLRASVERHLPKGPDRKDTEDPCYTAQAQEVLLLANSECHQLGHTYLGTEHILLGLLAAKNDTTAAIWADFEIDAEQVRLEILRELDPNFSPSRSGEKATTKKEKPSDTDAESGMWQDPRIRWPKPDPVDVSKRYDVYCIEHGQSVVYRNVLFKSKQGLLPDSERGYPSLYIGLELMDGKMIYLPAHSVFKFCDPGASAEGEKVPPPNP